MFGVGHMINHEARAFVEYFFWAVRIYILERVDFVRTGWALSATSIVDRGDITARRLGLFGTLLRSAL